MKILVTGATGYVGYQLALTLAENKDEIRILVRNPNSENIPQHRNIKVFVGDITEKESIKEAIMDCHQVYHTAALVKAFDKDPSLFYKVNVDGTLNLLESAVEAGVQKFVFTSSCSVFGSTIKSIMCENDIRTSPLDNDYDVTKGKAESLVKEYSNRGLNTVIVSPSKVYGPSGFETKKITMNKVICKFIKGQMVFIPKPSRLIANYCYINDVVDGHILAMLKGKRGENYILWGENISFGAFFRKIGSLTKKKGKLIEVPRLIMKLFAIIESIKFFVTKRDPLITVNSINQFYCNKIFSSEKAISQLGYKITPISDGLQQTIQFLNNQSHV